MSRQVLIDSLRKKLKDTPDHPKAKIWIKQLDRTVHNLENPQVPRAPRAPQNQKSRLPRQPRSNRKMSTRKPKLSNMESVQIDKTVHSMDSQNLINYKSKAFDFQSKVSMMQDIELGMAKSLSSLLDPDVGASRFPDSVTDPTAVYKSVMNIPIKADPNVDGGRFTIICQPILGNSANTSSYKIGYVRVDGSNLDLRDSSSFNTPSGLDSITADPNLDILLSNSEINATFFMTGPATNSAQNPVPLGVPQISGVGATNFVWANPSNPNQLNYTPTNFVIGIPPGQYHVSVICTATLGSASYMTAQNYQKQSIVNGAFVGFRSQATYLDSQSTSFGTPLDVLLCNNTASNTGVGTFNYSASTGSYFKILNGAAAVGSITGSGANTGSDLSVLATLQYALDVPAVKNKTFYTSIHLDAPPMSVSDAIGFQVQVRFTSTRLGTSASSYGTSGIIQKLRPTAMKAHLQFDAPLLTYGGDIAVSVLPGESQNNVFSSNGYSYTSFQNICSLNRSKKFYKGKVTEGCYAVYAPEQNTDYELISYQDSLSYLYPFIVITGNITSTGSPGLQTFANLRVVTNYEYTTTSQIVETKSQLGSDNFMQGITAAMSNLDSCHENPKHKSFFQNMLSTAGSIVETVAKVTPAISSVIKTVGAALL